MTSELRFDGRVAIVTGAGGGIGREYALLLGARGAQVVVNDVSAAAAAAVAGEVQAAGGSAIANIDSVSTPEGGQSIVAAAVDAYGTVDILINNAGILRDQSFHNLTPDNLDAVLDVHLRGAFFVTMPAYRIMRAKKYGRIVNTSSNSGLIGNFGQSNYGAAKMGIIGLTRVLAIEGQRNGIHVNAIAPAARTRMTEALIDAETAAALDPAYVAPAVAWLAHEDCPTTGEFISAGAGRVARYFIGLTPGYFDRDLTAEEVRDHWDEVRSTEGFIIPSSPSEEMDLIMAHWK